MINVKSLFENKAVKKIIYGRSLFFFSLKTFKSIILLIQITIRDDPLLYFKCCSNYYEEDINNTRG